ncbi:MAG: GtrA family protein [Bacillota bacterium]|nr:GtrA family protein [Bacillota bacterium]
MINKTFEKIKKLFLSKEFMVFLVIGGISAAINFISGFLFREAFSGKYFLTISIWVGFTAGSISSFVLNRLITFKAFDQKILNQIVKFAIMLVFSGIIASAIANITMKIYYFLSIDFISVKQMETISRLASIGLTTFFNYPAIKFFSFRKIEFRKKNSNV